MNSIGQNSSIQYFSSGHYFLDIQYSGKLSNAKASTADHKNGSLQYRFISPYSIDMRKIESLQSDLLFGNGFLQHLALCPIKRSRIESFWSFVKKLCLRLWRYLYHSCSIRGLLRVHYERHIYVTSISQLYHSITLLECIH